MICFAITLSLSAVSFVSLFLLSYFLLLRLPYSHADRLVIADDDISFSEKRFLFLSLFFSYHRLFFLVDCIFASFLIRFLLVNWRSFHCSTRPSIYYYWKKKPKKISSYLSAHCWSSDILWNKWKIECAYNQNKP